MPRGHAGVDTVGVHEKGNAGKRERTGRDQSLNGLQGPLFVIRGFAWINQSRMVKVRKKKKKKNKSHSVIILGVGSTDKMCLVNVLFLMSV